MKTKWTPGPWTLYLDRKAEQMDVGVNRPTGASCIARCRSANASIPLEQAEANARLIAKAPELADALLNLREAIRGHEASSDICTCGDPSAKCPIAEAERVLREAGAID